MRIVVISILAACLLIGACWADLATADDHRQQIRLHSDSAIERSSLVTLGIPFAPGQLTEIGKLGITLNGQSVPSRATETLNWHFKDQSIRAAKVEFAVNPGDELDSFAFVLDAGLQTVPPKVEPLPDATWRSGVTVPAVLATLSPDWMTASELAGPQLTFDNQKPYDRFVLTQYETWAGQLNYEGKASRWLFDRPTTLFKLYLRTGRADVLREAIGSYRFYIDKIKRDGKPGWPNCAGGWEHGSVKACNSKYVYIEPVLLALGLAAEIPDDYLGLTELMVGAWRTNGWSRPTRAYRKADQSFTERYAGLGLLALVSAYELTANPGYLEQINQRLDWLFEHQRANPDQQPADGSWRHSWQKHEGNRYDPTTDTRGASTWMSENIIDGLWHAWLVTRDPRIPVMVERFGRYLEKHGWIKQRHFELAGHTWQQSCVEPGAPIPWYWSSSLASDEELIKIQNSNGWYSDLHTVELALPVAAAMYFSSDQTLRVALAKRLELIERAMTKSCARSKSTPRHFNWNNRGTAAYLWMDGVTKTAP